MPIAPADSDELRRRLLTAGRRLVDTPGTPGLDETSVCAAADVTPEQLRQCFGGWQAYRCALLAALIDDTRARVARITSNMPAGIERLKLAVETYLETNVQRPLLRELLSELRFTDAGAELIRARVAGFGVMMGLELRALGRPHPEATARLLTAAVTEIAQAEHEAGCRLPAIRGTLLRYLDQAG
jgi:TetR/AcrR family transcriptional regulator, transcriptional repressor for nem operon